MELNEIRNDIWNEMWQAKFRMDYTMRYGMFQRKLASVTNTIVLISSIFGALGWDISKIIPRISCAVISLIAWTKFLFPKVIMSKEKIDAVEKINHFYTKYHNDLQRLWHKYETQTIDDSQAIEEFHKIKNKESKIDALVNDTIKFKPFWIEKTLKKEYDKHFKSSQTNHEQKNYHDENNRK